MCNARLRIDFRFLSMHTCNAKFGAGSKSLETTKRIQLRRLRTTRRPARDSAAVEIASGTSAQRLPVRPRGRLVRTIRRRGFEHQTESTHTSRTSKSMLCRNLTKNHRTWMVSLCTMSVLVSVCVGVVLISTFRCPEVGIQIFTFRCPEVGFDFSFLGVRLFG